MVTGHRSIQSIVIAPLPIGVDPFATDQIGAELHVPNINTVPMAIPFANCNDPIADTLDLPQPNRLPDDRRGTWELEVIVNAREESGDTLRLIVAVNRCLGDTSRDATAL